MITVIETDQWSACGDAFKFKEFDDLTQADCAESSKALFGGTFNLKEVDENARPYIGNVWFIKDPVTGKPKIWKANYDSSD